MRYPALALCLVMSMPFAACAQSSSTIVPAPAAPGGSTITPAPAAPGAAAKAAEPVSPEALKEAKALTAVLGINAQAKVVLQQVRDQVIQATINASGKSVAEASAVADEIMMPEFAAREQELGNLLVVPWALGFTPAELRELRTFYGTPLGKRVLAAMPRITQQSVQIGQEWMQRTFREAVAKHSEELRARGLKF